MLNASQKIAKNPSLRQNLIKYQNPYFIGNEIKNLHLSIKSKELIGPENFISKCEDLLENQLACKKALLTASGTDALEMACILANFKTKDEIIIPSFNFPSAATSIIRCGATPVFASINSSDMNISLKSIKKSITSNTKGIILTHYAGISAQISEIMVLAKKYNLIVIEDAAQAIYSKHKNKYLGTIGDFGVISFHQTKNIFCGEGGALLINKKKFINRAHIIREKGTNRNDFIQGKINKYGWVDIGSSFLPSSLQAAFLYAQLCEGLKINKKRKTIFHNYHKFFSNIFNNYNIAIPKICPHSETNGHFYWILVPQKKRGEFIKRARLNLLELTTHFEPLHNTKPGKNYGKYFDDLDGTNRLAKQIIRIPIHTQMTKRDQGFVIKTLQETINQCLDKLT